MPIVDLQSVTRSYGSRRGVEDVSLRVDGGTIFGFLGPNGAGKTTTIRILLGFLRPDAGAARVLGRDCWQDSARIKRDIGYLAGDVRLWPWLDGRRAVRITGALHGRDLGRAGAELFDRLELDPAVRVRAMSRGMRQKLGLVLALVHAPQVLVLDEPTSGLDPLMQDELATILRERAAAGATVFFSSHTLSRVEALCRRVAIVRGGRIVADEPLETLRARARRRVVVTFADAEAAAVEPPAGLRVTHREGTRWEGTLDGRGPELAAWAATQRLADLVIAAPDLAAIFRGYYVEGGPDADADGSSVTGDAGAAEGSGGGGSSP